MSFAHRKLVDSEGRRALRAWREVRELKQFEFSKQIGLSATALNHVEAGRSTPSLALAIRIEERTGIPCRAWKVTREVTRDQAAADADW